MQNDSLVTKAQTITPCDECIKYSMHTGMDRAEQHRMKRFEAVTNTSKQTRLPFDTEGTYCSVEKTTLLCRECAATWEHQYDDIPGFRDSYVTAINPTESWWADNHPTGP